MEEWQYILKIVSQIKDALSNRPKEKRIDDFLEIEFEKYNNLLKDYCLTDCLSEKQKQIVDLIENRILQSLKDYFNGKLSGALTEIQCLLQDLSGADGDNITILKKGEIWYRGRIKEEGSNLFNRKEMFHIPECLREKVNSQRFSYNGYPCLYLGKSIWACWEELDEPHLDDICFSAFKLLKDIRLLDLSIPSEEALRKKTPDDYPALLVSLPIMMACSIKTLNEKANFKSEYVVPQLMMAELLNWHWFDGYVFSSTKRNPGFDWKEEYLLNIVVPVVGKFDDDGLCISLKKTFLLTEPIYYKYEFLKSNVSNMIKASEQEINAIFDNTHDKQEEYEEEDLYPRALFGQMEGLLKKKEFSEIS